jgi:hypothetical protein
MESWRIYHCAHTKLDKGRLQNIYRRSLRQVHYWAANPRFAESRRNPIDRITLMLDELNLAGYGDYARAAIDIMAAPLDGQFAYKDPARSDKGTVDGEAADLLVAAGQLLDVIRAALADGELNAAERASIRKLMRETARQLEELADAAGMNVPK